MSAVHAMIQASAGVTAACRRAPVLCWQAREGSVEEGVVYHGSGKKGMRVLGRQHLEAEKLVPYGWGERGGTRKREPTGHSF